MASSKPVVPDEILKLHKKFGEMSIYKMDGSHIENVEVIPTGSLELDLALGVGGLPLGRVVEIYGPNAGGKTTLCQHIIAEAQKLDHPTAYIDMEHALDPAYAVKCGMKFGEDGVYFSQPDTGEQALEIADVLIHSGKPYVIIVDSVAALVPQAEIEGEMGQSHMGLQARLMSQAMRKMTVALKSSNALLVFTNQIRMKIGVQWGSPETQPGGEALKFAASVRLDVRRMETKKTDGVATANKVKVRVVKNKVADPFREAIFDIEFGRGINHEAELVDLGVTREIITKRGSHYSLGDIKLGNSRENSFRFLKDAPDLAQSIEVSIRESFKEHPMQVGEVAEDESETE